jgi:sec-independent protein translocase protein TatB
MLNIGPQELIVVLIIALIVVGPQRLPELGRTIGKAMREFRKIQDDVKDSIRFDLDTEPDQPVRPSAVADTPIEFEHDEDDDAPAAGSAATTVIETGAMPDRAVAVEPDTTAVIEPIEPDDAAGPLAAG